MRKQLLLLCVTLIIIFPSLALAQGYGPRQTSGSVGTGTPNAVLKRDTATTAKDSNITDDGTAVTVNSPIKSANFGSTDNASRAIVSGTSATTNDVFKLTSASAGASFQLQNTNSAGFTGIEYLDQTGATKVFSGYNNANAKEFRFNNLASGGNTNFLLAGTSVLNLSNGTATVRAFATNVTNVTANYNVLSSDHFICVRPTGSMTVNLPAGNLAGTTGQEFIIKDCNGTAATNTITITATSGTIDGAASKVINTNRGVLSVKKDGTDYQIFQ